MFVLRYTDSIEAPANLDYAPPLAYESVHATEQDALAWKSTLETNYPSWTVETPREEAEDYVPEQIRRQAGA